MRRFSYGLSASTIVLLLSPGAFGASFDCATSGLTQTERMICANPELSALDSNLATLFANAKVSALPENKSQLVDQQKKWLNVRNACTVTACIQSAYIDRIAALSTDTTPSSGTLTAAASPPSAGSPVSNGNESGSAEIQSASLIRQLGKAIEAAGRLSGQGIGFKEYRLGKRLGAQGILVGTDSCEAVFSFDPKDNQNADQEVLKALAEKWGTSAGSILSCAVKTTIFERPTTARYIVAGSERVVTRVDVEVATVDLPLLMDALTKALGSPRQETIKVTREELQAELARRYEPACNLQALKKGVTYPVGMERMAELDLQKCRRNTKLLSGMELGLANAADGVTGAIVEWAPSGALVGYVSSSAVDKTTVRFAANEVSMELINGIQAAIQADSMRLATEVKQATDNRRAQDFLSDTSSAPSSTSSRVAVLRAPSVSDYYPSVSISNHEEGTAKIRLCYDVNGKVLESTLSTGTRYSRLNAAAIVWGKSVHLKPGTVDGVPQAACVIAPVRFSLKDLKDETATEKE